MKIWVKKGLNSLEIKSLEEEALSPMSGGTNAILSSLKRGFEKDLSESQPRCSYQLIVCASPAENFVVATCQSQSAIHGKIYIFISSFIHISKRGDKV